MDNDYYVSPLVSLGLFEFNSIDRKNGIIKVKINEHISLTTLLDSDISFFTRQIGSFGYLTLPGKCEIDQYIHGKAIVLQIPNTQAAWIIRDQLPLILGLRVPSIGRKVFACPMCGFSGKFTLQFNAYLDINFDGQSLSAPYFNPPLENILQHEEIVDSYCSHCKTITELGLCRISAWEKLNDTFIT